MHTGASGRGKGLEEGLGALESQVTHDTVSGGSVGVDTGSRQPEKMGRVVYGRRLGSLEIG